MPDGAGSVRLQRQLIELNTLSHVFTRTKKREVAELFPLRRAHWINVQFSAEEREFYALDKLWKDCPTIPFVDRDMVDADTTSGVA